MTKEVKGKLFYMKYDTSTIVNDKVINTGMYGIYVFYLKELRCKMLNQDLK